MPQMRPSLWIFIYLYTLLNCYVNLNLNYFYKKMHLKPIKNNFFFMYSQNLKW